MLTRASNWRGTAINAIRGTRGLSGARRCGMGADVASPDADIADLAALLNQANQYGPDANVVAPLQIGKLAQSAAGQYSINPQTGQLQANMIPGLSNSALLAIGGGLLGLALFAGIARGRR